MVHLCVSSYQNKRALFRAHCFFANSAVALVGVVAAALMAKVALNTEMNTDWGLVHEKEKKDLVKDV